MSIYETIKNALNDEGRLPCDFELPHDDIPPNEIKWAVGAKDGIFVHHASPQKSEEAIKKIIALLKSGKPNRIPAIFKKHSVIDLVDPLLAAIRKNADDLNATMVCKYAQFLAFESDDEELVKLGIALLGLFDWSDTPEMQEKLITLGLYEEFTLYVVVEAQRWDNGNEVLFRIAKSVDGWGKIHTVKRLKPETEEIREWILRHGCKNAVMNAYLGLECANKGDLIGVLRRDELDAELFDSVCIVVDALMDEGPTEGISAYEYAEEALLRFLHFADRYAVSLKHIWHVLNIESFLDLAEITSKDEIKHRCKEIAQKPVWKTIVLSTMANPDPQDFFYANDVARRLNIEVESYVYDAVKNDPIGNSAYLPVLYKKPEYAKELTELYERVLPLEEMAAGMGDYIFSPTHRQECNCLDTLLHELYEHPLLGERLVRTGLLSPVVRNRNIACAALEKWSKKLGQPVSVFSPNLFETLQSMAAIEVDKDVKKTLNKIIKGKK
jgi:hypothetical protein